MKVYIYFMTIIIKKYNIIYAKSFFYKRNVLDINYL